MNRTLTIRIKIMLVLILAASTILISDFYGYFSSGKAPKRPTASPVRAPKEPSQPKPTPASRLAPPPPADQPWKRDPFLIGEEHRPRSTEPKDHFSGLKLSGIVGGPQGYTALLNDFVVKPGDRVKGVQVLSITRDGVLLEKDGETRFLRLRQGGILPFQGGRSR